MRVLEIIVAVVLALIVFVALKIMGMLIHVALIGAAVGFVLGLVITFAFRGRSSS
ncbi:MAG TPA: hypothetical protein VG387_08435 [Rhizomicrobium sp.]|jgi:hypothetical protein|nr:hypothetical protein [Rhizomicrobium sp.]